MVTAIQVGVLVHHQQQNNPSGRVLDVRILRSIATGIYAAQMELFDAIEILGDSKDAVIGSGDVHANGEEGPGEWRFKKRKEMSQLADDVIETGKNTLSELKNLVNEDPASMAIFTSVDGAFTSFVRARNRLNGASSLDFSLYQSFGEDAVAFVQVCDCCIF
ncbi:UNVERIFIED_CONTAM: hypothetical protein HDU68_009976 [Siphonaria sp. JEL0065]|nr:hypothetical protein HDU68_009976 [Siphonaria sp. JEL0065]